MRRADPHAPELRIPFFLSRPQAGFPSPAFDDGAEPGLDINSYIVNRPESTFFVKVRGDSMEGAGIFSGDVLVVDRSMHPSPGRIVLSVLNGEFSVKRIVEKGGKTFLASEPGEVPRHGWSGRFPTRAFVELSSTADSPECFVWGVVVGVLRKL